MKLEYLGFIMSNLSLSSDNYGRVYVKAQNIFFAYNARFYSHSRLIRWVSLPFNQWMPLCWRNILPQYSGWKKVQNVATF